MKPTLAITMGDINGIGPEILAKALARPHIFEVCQPVVLGSARVYEAARLDANLCPEAVVVADVEEARRLTQGIPFLECGAFVPESRPGVLSAEAGACAFTWIKHATALALEGKVDGIVTCPINKEGIHRAGHAFAGHTDFIAEMTGTEDYRMGLFTDTMRIVHLTGHLTLREALDQVRKERIVRSIRLGQDALDRLGTPLKRIAVAGLNPHAGEAGAFGFEERDEIAPAVEQCRAEGLDCSGPYPADTVFRRMHHGEFDIVIAMYHDQGHVPLKLMAMDEGVNVTLGIPITRTSVDHGTAYDIAGKGVAREHSLCAALAMAAQLACAPHRAAS